MNTSFLHKSITVFFIFCFQSISSFAVDFYVSPNGNDKNPGTREKPFVTIEQAKQAVLNSVQNNKDNNFYIWLADGFYEIKSPLVFNAPELGNLDIEITVKALEEANPVISGGIVLKGWEKKENGIWVADLPGTYKNSNPRELFIEGIRGIRARSPNEGYLRVKQVGEDRHTNFFFNEGEFPIPEKKEEVELIFLYDWSIARIGVKEIDSKKNKLTAVDSIGVKNSAYYRLDRWEKHPRYFLENAIEFLDADNEWFYDLKKSKVYLKLPESRDPEHLQIVVPVSAGLIQLKGKEDNLIKNIHFEGITFQHCAWGIPKLGYGGVQACYFKLRSKGQASTALPAAVKAEWTENCSFKNCSFENLGTSGLWLSTGCKNCTVQNSGFEDISGNGIMIGEGKHRLVNGTPWWQEAPGQAARGNTIENCTITECGSQFYGAVGIWCGLAAETTIRNNEVYNLPYTGVSVGWMWNTTPTPCRANLIEGNHIHHVMQILSDGGGIYTLGLQPGSKILKNHIHDIKTNAGKAESNGMFLDQGTTNMVVANNLIYNIAKCPIRFNVAPNNLIKDNYLFCTGENPPIWYGRETEEEDIKTVGNKVYSESDENYNTELEKIINEFKITVASD